MIFTVLPTSLRIRSKDNLTQRLTEAIQDWRNLMGELRTDDKWSMDPMTILVRFEEELARNPSQVTQMWRREVHGWMEDVVKLRSGHPAK
jgi:hypothetical protein